MNSAFATGFHHTSRTMRLLARTHLGQHVFGINAEPKGCDLGA